MLCFYPKCLKKVLLIQSFKHSNAMCWSWSAKSCPKTLQHTWPGGPGVWTYPVVNGQVGLPLEPQLFFGLTAKCFWPSREPGTADHLDHTLLTSCYMHVSSSKEDDRDWRSNDWTQDIPKAKKKVLASTPLKNFTFQHDYTSPSQVALGQGPECSRVALVKAQTWTPLKTWRELKIIIWQWS